MPLVYETPELNEPAEYVILKEVEEYHRNKLLYSHGIVVACTGGDRR
jgi:hypothetical protein